MQLTLTAQLELANKERDTAQELAMRVENTQGHPTRDPNQIQMLSKPKGEAGDGRRGFNLREAMDLEGDANKELYEAIQVCILIWSGPVLRC